MDIVLLSTLTPLSFLWIEYFNNATGLLLYISRTFSRTVSPLFTHDSILKRYHKEVGGKGITVEFLKIQAGTIEIRSIHE